TTVTLPADGYESERLSSIASGVEAEFDDRQETLESLVTTSTETTTATTTTPTERTIVFLDWDDTLLPTSWLQSRGYHLFMNSEERIPEVDDVLERIGEQVVALFYQLLQQSDTDVYVVSNSETGWIRMSATTFLPAVAPFF